MVSAVWAPVTPGVSGSPSVTTPEPADASRESTWPWSTRCARSNRAAECVASVMAPVWQRVPRRPVGGTNVGPTWHALRDLILVDRAADRGGSVNPYRPLPALAGVAAAALLL